MALLEKCAQTQGPQKNIIVCDAAGVRGLFALEIYAFIAKHHSKPLTELVSLCAGASSGAMVSTLVSLGFLDETSESYTDVKKFYHLLPHFFEERTNQFLKKPGYTGTGKRRVLEMMLKDKRMRDVKIPLLILSSTVSGESIEWKSWDPRHKDLLLVDLVDASSAIPTMFPPVYVPGTGEIGVDGGVRGCSGIFPALLSVLELFPGQMQCQIRMLSIGVMYTDEKRITVKDIPNMGLLRCIALKIVQAILGTYDRTPQRVMSALLGDRFLRVACESKNVRIDDTSERVQNGLKEAAASVWAKQGDHILKFLGTDEAKRE